MKKRIEMNRNKILITRINKGAGMNMTKVNKKLKVELVLAIVVLSVAATHSEAGVYNTLTRAKIRVQNVGKGKAATKKALDDHEERRQAGKTAKANVRAQQEAGAKKGIASSPQKPMKESAATSEKGSATGIESEKSNAHLGKKSPSEMSEAATDKKNSFSNPMDDNEKTAKIGKGMNGLNQDREIGGGKAGKSAASRSGKKSPSAFDAAASAKEAESFEQGSAATSGAFKKAAKGSSGGKKSQSAFDSAASAKEAESFEQGSAATSGAFNKAAKGSSGGKKSKSAFDSAASAKEAESFEQGSAATSGAFNKAAKGSTPADKSDYAKQLAADAQEAGAQADKIDGHGDKGGLGDVNPLKKPSAGNTFFHRIDGHGNEGGLGDTNPLKDSSAGSKFINSNPDSENSN